MERSTIGMVIGSLLGLTMLGPLLGLVVKSPNSGVGSLGPEPGRRPGKLVSAWRLLEPVQYENIAIFPVVSSSERDTGLFLTLDEGLASGEVLVTERGNGGLARSRDGRAVTIPDYNERSSASVNELVLVNRSKRPLLLLAGELVSGGKQDRIIGKDRIVPVGAPPLPLDVFCVEHGRWSAGSQFVASKIIVHPSVREQAALNRDQGNVWEAVRNGNLKARSAPAEPVGQAPPRINSEVLSQAITVEAPTQSYDKIYERGRVGGSVDAFVREVQRRFARATSQLKGERLVGVVVAYGGEVAWSDIFASSDLFGHYWDKLLRSYAVEALSRPTLKQVASQEQAATFLERLNGREESENEPGVYRWSETSDGRLAEIQLEALAPKPMMVHRLFLHRTT
jgi:hypothetical protein